MQKKALLKKLSEVFNRGVYDAARDLDEYGWFHELNYRTILYHLADLGEKASLSEEETVEYLESEFVAMAQQIGRFSLKDAGKKESKTLGLKELTFRDVFELEREAARFREARLAFLRMNRRIHFDNSAPLEILRHSFHEALMERFERHALASRVPIEVDLSATDDVLKRSFDYWLKEKRKTLSKRQGTKRVKKFNSARFRKWGNYRILAYLDLLLFEKYFDVSIPNHYKARLLFPPDASADMGERIRRVIKPEADAILNDSTIDALFMYCKMKESIKTA